MKKRLMAVLMIAVMMFSLVGCSPNMMSYSKELQRVSQWEGTSIDAKANIEVEVKDEKAIKFSIPMELKGKSKGQNLVQMNMKMDLKAIKSMAKELGEEIPVSIPDEVNMNIFATNEKAYIEKKFFTDMLGDEASEELKNIKEDYLAINIGANSMQGANTIDQAKIETITKYMQSKEFEAEIFGIVEKAFKGFKPSTDVKVKDNTYSYEASINDIVKDFNNAVDSVVNNYSEFEEPIIELMKKFEMPIEKEDLKEMVNSYNKEKFEEQTKLVEETLKGSKISSKTTFDKDSYTQEIKYVLNVENMVSMNMTMTTNSKKVDNVEITLPTSVKEITMMEYFTMISGISPQEISGPMIFVKVNGEEIYFEDQEPVLKENRTLVPVRALLENIGAEVKWDQKAQKVSAKKDDMDIELIIGSKVAKVNGKEVNLDVPAEVLNNRTMIPLRFISENLGYKVKFDNENSPIYMIDIYNISDEELAKKEEEKLKELEAMFADEKEEQIAKEEVAK